MKPVDIHEIRHTNLLSLDKKHGGLKAIERLTEGRITANYLSQLKTRNRNIGDKAARKLERMLELPEGWMDTIRDSDTLASNMLAGSGAFDNAAPAQMVTRVPLVSWVQAGEWSAVEDPHPRGVSEEWIPVYERVSRTSFALRVRGDSMTNPNGFPTFPAGTTVIVDPQEEARSGRFVIARLTDDLEATFKQLVIEGGQTYLMPLNPRYPRIDVDQEMVICGVVVAIAQVRLI